MAIMPIGTGKEESTCGCGGCNCGASDVAQPAKEETYQVITEL